MPWRFKSLFPRLLVIFPLLLVNETPVPSGLGTNLHPWILPGYCSCLAREPGLPACLSPWSWDRSFQLKKTPRLCLWTPYKTRIFYSKLAYSLWAMETMLSILVGLDQNPGVAVPGSTLIRIWQRSDWVTPEVHPAESCSQKSKKRMPREGCKWCYSRIFIWPSTVCVS